MNADKAKAYFSPRLRASTSRNCPRALPIIFIAVCCYAQSARVDPSLYLDDVKFLASQELRGRASGSPELEKAAAFLVSKYREFGIRPVPGQDYLQPFAILTGGTLGKGNRLSISSEGHATTLK